MKSKGSKFLEVDKYKDSVELSVTNLVLLLVVFVLFGLFLPILLWWLYTQILYIFPSLPMLTIANVYIISWFLSILRLLVVGK